MFKIKRLTQAVPQVLVWITEKAEGRGEKGKEATLEWHSSL